MRSLLLCLAFAAGLGAADAPKLVATPATSVTVADSTPLSVGKFLFVAVANYDGPVTYDVTGGERVKILSVKGGTFYGGVKEGQDEPNHHEVPASKAEVLVVLGAKNGECSIAAWGVVEGKPSKISTLILNVGGGKPEPMPNPKPDPKPDPKPEPYTGKWRIAVVEETSTAAANRGQYFSDPELLAYVKAKCSSRPRIVDQDVKDKDGQPPKDMVPWLALAKGKKLPQWFIVGDDGTIILQGDLPPLPKEALEALKKVGG